MRHAWLRFGIIILFLIGIAGMMYFKPEKSTVINKTENYQVSKIYFTRELVNDSISRKLRAGQVQDVYEIYSNLCKDQELISMIIFKALERDIPVNLLMALIEQESDFNVKAINKNDKSVDYGLMQLNSNRFRKYKAAQLFDVRINLDLGTQLLVELQKKNDSWEYAILSYNGWGDDAVLHLTRVLKRERSIDALYNSF